MHHLNSCSQRTDVSSIDPKATELQDVGDMPRAQPNRFLAIVMLIAAVMTIGHFVSTDRMSLPNTDALAQTVSTHG